MGLEKVSVIINADGEIIEVPATEVETHFGEGISLDSRNEPCIFIVPNEVPVRWAEGIIMGVADNIDLHTMRGTWTEWVSDEPQGLNIERYTMTFYDDRVEVVDRFKEMDTFPFQRVSNH